jgi:hypothetical protein
LTPFHHRPNAALGAALRQALAPGDEAAFIARIKAAVDAPRPGQWEVLASWARTGIVAASAALLAGLMIGGAFAPRAPVIDLVASAASPVARRMVVTVRPPHPSVLLLWTEEE